MRELSQIDIVPPLEKDVIIKLLKDRKFINAGQHEFLENKCYQTNLVSFWKDYKLD